MRIVTGYENTRGKEDFALTPYISIVYVKKMAYGFGLCWGFHGVFIAVGINLPKSIKFFNNYTKNK